MSPSISATPSALFIAKHAFDKKNYATALSLYQAAYAIDTPLPNPDFSAVRFLLDRNSKPDPKDRFFL